MGVSRLPEPYVVAVEGFTPDGAPFGADTMVYVGSLAKQITAACAALLVLAGHLDIESPITTWLPELPGWAQAIRVRHLIHHTGDMPDEETVWTAMQRAGTRDRTSPGVLLALATMPSHKARPGTRYAYSNYGYVCLASIVERVVLQPLAAFAHAHLFAPLAMRQTTFWAGPAPAPPGGTALARSLSPAPLSLGDGGLWTTLHDLLRWNDALIGDVLGITRLLHTPGHLDDGTPLDYAWGVRVFEQAGWHIQSHGGGWKGATAKLLRLPDNRSSVAAVALHDDIDRIVRLIASVQQLLIMT
ncbi:MAG: serine hydrolase [Actinomycetota bacterium]|nr:serine hydrolase [Actinomycetota bacterium]